MSHEARRKALLKKHGLSGVNKPKRTPKHKTKSHVVLAQDGHTMKLIRYGQQGVSGAGSSPKSAKEKARRKSFKARHAKNIAKGKMSAIPSVTVLLISTITFSALSVIFSFDSCIAVVTKNSLSQVKIDI